MSEAHLAELLIVDDEEALMRSLCDTLRARGYGTTGFTNPAEALASLRENRYELMLADMAMPGMDGIALMREALGIDDLLVVVIMTGEGTIATAVEAMRSGAYDYILKPFKLASVLPVLQRGLGMRALRVENTRLETRLLERAAELESANRELDAFTRSASHDLRSPLTGVIGLCRLLSAQYGSQLPLRAAQWIDQIELELTRVVDLLDGLMRLSRLGKQALVVQDVDMVQLAREVVADLTRQDPARTVDVRVHAMPPAVGDEGLLRQVYANLVSNALKFTRGTRAAVIEVGHRVAEGNAAYYVRDNGVGFDMAAARGLFDAFRRLHRDEQYEGTGVGLSIVRRIVERHGGRAWAESAPGSGSCFSFTLDMQEHAEQA